MTVTATRGSLVKIKDSTIYYPHQLDGVRKLANRTSFLLSDEMGLGKTLQALTVAAIDFERGSARRVLVVAPATLKWNWAAEIETYTNFTCFVLDGTPKQRLAQLDTFTQDILIVNPEQVIAHLDALNASGFDIVIYDEAHFMKSRLAKRTQACQGLGAKRHFLLTGSPLLNHIDDLWSLLYRIDPNEFPTYWKFVNRYAVFGGYKDKQIVGIKHERELRRRVQDVMLRRCKADVLDLPDKIRTVIQVDLHPEQAKLYKQATDELRIDLPDKPDPLELENALTKMLRLKQVCGTTASIPGHPDYSSKLDVAVERIQELVDSGERVVVFTQFRSVLACLAERLGKLKIPTWQVHGDTPQRDRVDTVDRWGAGKVGVLACMLQVAGVGLNMTAASHCIFLDKLWAPKLNEQAEDRLHRIGAEKHNVITIIEIIARNTVEQRVETILRRKEKLFGSVVNEDRWKRALVEALMDEDNF